MLSERSQTHGLSSTPEYNIWQDMLKRCRPTSPSRRYYADKGVKVSALWRRSFLAFLGHIGKRPSAAHSIDRFPDRDGSYVPGNVRWALRVEQNRNRRNVITHRHAGIALTLPEWAERVGLPYRTLKQRIADGWTIGRAVTTPRRNH